MVSGKRLALVWMGMTLTFIRMAFMTNKNPVKAILLLRSMLKVRRENLNENKRFKALRSGSEYFWSINIPGWPSEKFNHFVLNEFQRILSPDKNHLQTIVFSITNKCPLHCAHCYESENLSNREKLSFEELKCIMDKIRGQGIRHIQFSGGEPLSRFEDMIGLMEYAGPHIEYWVSTSGFGLTAERARIMKKSGMTGVILSLDDWDEKRHNHFRGNDRSFFWVREAAKNAGEAGILVCVSLCPLKEFVSEENLARYYQLAKELGAGFVRIMEPRAIGRFSGKDVLLNNMQLRMIEDFMIRGNYDRAYADYPIILFSGFFLRKLGCSGAGNRFIFIDSNGRYHTCPFCRNPLGNLLEESLETAIHKAKATGCPLYKRNQF